MEKWDIIVKRFHFIHNVIVCSPCAHILVTHTKFDDNRQMMTWDRQDTAVGHCNCHDADLAPMVKQVSRGPE